MKLSELYTQEEFTTFIKNTYNTSLSLDLVDDKISSSYALLVSFIIYDFYGDNNIAYLTKEKFEKRLSTDLNYYSQKDYAFYKEQYNLYMNNKIDNKGNLTTNRDVKMNQTTGSFTKQANTPSVVTPSTDFVDDYTNYQSNTDRDFKSNDNYKTTIERTYGNLEILDVYKRLPRSIFNNIIQCAKWHFYIIESE